VTVSLGAYCFLSVESFISLTLCDLSTTISVYHTLYSGGTSLRVSTITTQIYAFGSNVSSTFTSLKKVFPGTSIYSYSTTSCFSTVHRIFAFSYGNLTNTFAVSPGL
jgi:hypothetical protein